MKLVKTLLIALICVSAVYLGLNLWVSAMKAKGIAPRCAPSRSIDNSIDSGLFIQEYEISSSSFPDSILNSVLCFEHIFTEIERYYSFADRRFYINDEKVILNFQHSDRTRHLFVYNSKNNDKENASWSVYSNARYSEATTLGGKTCLLYVDDMICYSKDSTITLGIGRKDSPCCHGWIKLSPVNNVVIAPVKISDRSSLNSKNFSGSVADILEPESFDSVIGNRLSYYGDYFLMRYEPSKYPESYESYLPVRIPSPPANNRKERRIGDEYEMTGMGCRYFMVKNADAYKVYEEHYVGVYPSYVEFLSTLCNHPEKIPISEYIDCTFFMNSRKVVRDANRNMTRFLEKYTIKENEGLYRVKRLFHQNSIARIMCNQSLYVYLDGKGHYVFKQSDS